MLQMPSVGSARGNTKILFVGLLALIAALTLEFRNRSQQRKAQAHLAALRAESDVIADSLLARLRNADTCTEALSGEVVEPGKVQAVTLHYEFDKQLVAAGTSITEGGLKMARLDLEIPDKEDMRTTVQDARGVATEVWRFAATLRPQFVSQKNEPVGATRATTEGLPFFVWSLPPPPLGSGQIVSCFHRDSSAFLCNELGGYFVPGTKPYDQSCRLSLKTLKRTGMGLVPTPNCRLGGIASKPSECAKFGVKFGADQTQGESKIVAWPGNRYLCQVCQ